MGDFYRQNQHHSHAATTASMCLMYPQLGCSMPPCGPLGNSPIPVQPAARLSARISRLFPNPGLLASFQEACGAMPRRVYEFCWPLGCSVASHFRQEPVNNSFPYLCRVVVEKILIQMSSDGKYKARIGTIRCRPFLFTRSNLSVEFRLGSCKERPCRRLLPPNICNALSHRGIWSCAFRFQA